MEQRNINELTGLTGITSSFLEFFQKPDLRRYEGTIAHRIPSFLKVLFTGYIVSMLIGFFVIMFFAAPETDSRLVGLYTDFPVYYTLILFIFVAVTEECVFRSLLNFRYITVYIFLTAAAVFTAAQFYNLSPENFFSFILLCALLVLSVHFIFSGLIKIKKTRRFFTLIKFLSRKYLNIFIWTSSVLFGLMHIINYRGLNTPELFFSTLFLTLPLVFTGFVFAFIRLRFGLVWAAAAHFIHNSTAFFIGKLIMRLLEN